MHWFLEYGAVAKEFVPLFFGTGFDLVVPLLYTLAPYIIFVSWANVLKTQVLLPNNKDMTFVVCLILGAFVNVVLNYCLIGTSGAVGAAIATTISEGLIAVSETVALRKLIDVKQLSNSRTTLYIIWFFNVQCDS